MSDLLELAVAAHGGLARWNRFRALRAKMAIRGAIFEAKRIAGLQDDVTYEVQLREERVTVDQFGGSNRRLRFLPSRLVLESFEGDIIETRDNPRDAFKDHTADSPWDALHLGYFSSYALWTYLNLPFLYTYPGFVVEEIAPWPEAGEEWRRLKATFPEGVASHAPEQVTYFGPDGLMCRHDYTVEAAQWERTTRPAIETSRASRCRRPAGSTPTTHRATRCPSRCWSRLTSKA